MQNTPSLADKGNGKSNKKKSKQIESNRNSLDASKDFQNVINTCFEKCTMQKWYSFIREDRKEQLQ